MLALCQGYVIPTFDEVAAFLMMRAITKKRENLGNTGYQLEK